MQHSLLFMKRSRSDSPDQPRRRRRTEQARRLRDITIAAYEQFRRRRIERAYQQEQARETHRQGMRRIFRHLPNQSTRFTRRIEARLAREQEAAQDALRRAETIAARLPTYDISTTRADGHLHTITYRVLTTGGNNHNREAAQRNLATMMRAYTRNVVMNEEPGWTADNANNWIHGYVQVTNRTNPQAVHRTTLNHLRDLNQAMINTIYERFNQSETETDFDDLDWTIVIAPQAYNHGGGIDIQKVKKTKTGQLSWENHSDDSGKLNCAAIALTILAFPSKNYNTRKNLLYNRARALQTELGWGDIVSIADLADFVEKYPKYRLTCLTAVERDFNRNTFIGKEFDGVIDATTSVNKNPFVLYVYFDHQQRHFAAETCPASIFNHLYSKGARNHAFCHKCIQVFSKDVAHVCEDSFVRNEKRIQKRVKCDRCDKEFQKSQNHNCDEFKCRNCHAQVPKGHEHRCAIMVHEKEELGYWDGISPYKKGKPGLWVWDIEASMEKVYVPFFTLYDFETDENERLKPIADVSYYVNRSPKEKAEYLKAQQNPNTVLRHRPNLIVLKNVITKATHILNGYEDTDDPFKAMIDMLLNTNHGDHILLAHNSAGYSKLI